MKVRKMPALIGIVALVAGACGGSSGATAAPSLPQSIGAGEGALNLVIWAGYAERGAVDAAYDWVTPFETKTGCKVSTTDMTDSNNGVSLMQSGDYDGISASGDATTRLIAGGIAAPVNTAILPNYKNVFEGLKNLPHNTVDGVNYGVPHGRGPNLLAYNTGVVTPAPTTWDPVWEGGADYKGKISVYDSSIYIADAALHLMTTQPNLGIKDPYQLTQAQFDAAVKLLELQRDNGALYWGTASDQVTSLTSGDIVVGTTWQYQVNTLKAESQPVAAVLPDEGSTGWSDTWMLSSQAKNPNCGYLFMNHIISPEANAQATEYFGEAPANTKSCALTVDPNHCETYHATDEAYFDKVYYWATPQAQCLDGRTGVVCKDYSEWSAAWTEIKG